MIRTFTVNDAFDGYRLTDVLSRQLEMSATLKKRIRLHGSVHWNSQPLRLIDTVQAGSVIKVDDGELPITLKAGHGLDVLYEDKAYIAVNKPAGYLTHPTAHQHDPSVLERVGKSLRAVGRLDKDTSGVLLLAKDAYSHHFAVSHPMRKLYTGFCHGLLQYKRLTIDGPIDRSNQQYLRRIVGRDGKPATTRMLSLAENKALALSFVAFRLDSGRTHQIRVHALYNGTPLLGDWLYGLAQLEDVFPGKSMVAPNRAAYAESLFTNQAFALDEKIKRQALHAASLSFMHPIKRQRVRITAPLPDDLRCLYQHLHHA